MEAFFKNIWDSFLNYISQYSFFIDLNYYEGLFAKYFSVVGFILGVIFVLMVYFSSTDEEERVAYFVKILPVIAVINSCAVLSNFINLKFHQSASYMGAAAVINASDNIISGFVLTLVICSCYRDYWKEAFLFGAATHAALPLLNFSYVGLMSGDQLIFLILRILLVGLVCLIISYRTHFYTSWIWYFSYHVLFKASSFALLTIYQLEVAGKVVQAKEVALSTLKYLSGFKVDGVIFVGILVFAIVFERSVRS